MARLPNFDSAVRDVRKLSDYCLDPAHRRGRNKARVFWAVLDITREDANWLKAAILDALPDADAFEDETDQYGTRWRVDLRLARQGKQAMVRTNWILRTGEGAPSVRLLLGAVMEFTQTHPSLLDVVALLDDIPARGLARGQVGTVVESLGQDTALVEFTDEEGRAYAIAPVPLTGLLVLQYEPHAAK